MPLTERVNARRSSSKQNESSEPFHNNHVDEDDVNAKGHKKPIHFPKKSPRTALFSLVRIRNLRLKKYFRVSKSDSTNKRVKATIVIFSVGVLIVVVHVLSYHDPRSIGGPTRRNLPKRQLTVQRPNSVAPIIKLHNFGIEESSFNFMSETDLKSPNVDYGGLNLNFIQPGDVFERQIRPDPMVMEGHVWTKKDYDEGEFDEYYAFDDDFVRNIPFKATKKQCRRNAWHRLYVPNCNTFHEIKIMKGTNRKLGSGAYREVYLQHETYDPDLVVKVQRYRRNPFKTDRYEFIRMDALVMERLTSSPRIADIYGHCATSIYSEFLPTEIEGMVVHGDGVGENLHDQDDVHPNNDLTPSMRLDMALQMAESIADLHGFQDGVLVHDDIQLLQFLFTPDGRLKLNDFNRGEAMLFDENDGSYCKYQNGKGGGEYRSPEEYKDGFLNEKIDIWSYGNNIYAMLTGLWPFYGHEIKELQKKLIRGETPFLDPRYRGRNYIHDKLIEVMERCWIYEPDERIDIFEIVKILRDSKVEAQRRGIYQPTPIKGT